MEAGVVLLFLLAKIHVAQSIILTSKDGTHTPLKMLWSTANSKW
jgi:hypothetical protein